MTDKSLPTPELLRKLLRYEPDTGKLFWRYRGIEMFSDKKQPAKHNQAIWNGKHANKIALSALSSNGYKHGSIFNRGYLAHRVIWAMETGEWPKDQIDHINHIRHDNRWINLREATHLENARNLTLRVNNTSGVTGVYWDKKWQARIGTGGGKEKHLGRFECKADAIAARKDAEIEFGFSPNHGR